MSVARQTASVTLVVALGVTGCGWLDDSQPTTAGSAAVIPAVRGSLAVSVPAKGYLAALSASPVVVPRVPTGALKVRALAPEGSLIEAGDIVVTFDDSQLSIDLDNELASFRSAERRIDKTQLQSEIESGTIGVMKEVATLELDNAETFRLEDESIYSKLEILETSVQKEEAAETILFADASLKLRGEYYDIEERILGVEQQQVSGKIERVKTSLGNMVLKAPIGGMVVYKKNWRGGSIAVGDTIWPGNAILSIVDPSSTALHAFLLERDAAGVQVGSTATVEVDARPGHRFRGKVLTVAELSRPIERGSPVKYFEVKIEIEQGDPTLLKPGMKGEARIELGVAEDAVVVPRSAVRGEADARYVVIRGPGGAERRPVTEGLGDQVRVTIEDALDGGELIVLGPDPTSAPARNNGDSAAVAAGG